MAERRWDRSDAVSGARLARWRAGSVRGFAGRLAGGFVRDVAIVGFAVGLALLSDWAPLSDEVQAQVTVVLALMAGAVAGAAAVGSSLVSRLSDDPRTPWVGSATMVYGLVAVPVMAMGSSFDSARATIAVARVATNAVVVVLLAVAIRPPRWVHGVRGIALFCGSVVLIAAAAFGARAGLVELSVSERARLALLGAWLVIGVALMLTGSRGTDQSRLSTGSLSTRSPRWTLPPLTRVGFGVVVIVLAHGYWIESGSARPIVDPGLLFSWVRLCGVWLVFLGLLGWTAEAIRELTNIRDAQRRELLEAAIRLDRLAERDHELRTGLACLAGAAHSWNIIRRDQQQLVFTAAHAELDRLRALLRAAPGQHASADSDSTPGADVADVLEKVEALWRAGGMDIDCHVQPGPRARIPATVLHQVLTNVLSNCARHAPDSPVRLCARTAERTITVRIIDRGPGLPAGAEDTVFDRGVQGIRDAVAPDESGQGLGLYISRTLLSAHGASIDVDPTSGGSGCTVRLELPAETAVRSLPSSLGVPHS